MYMEKRLFSSTVITVRFFKYSKSTPTPLQLPLTHLYYAISGRGHDYAIPLYSTRINSFPLKNKCFSPLLPYHYSISFFILFFGVYANCLLQLWRVIILEMVSARLVDHPDSPEEQQMRPIPKMMFAAGEEPVGVRVLTYQSSSVLKRIFNALEEDEVEIIRQSSFGRLIEIADKPVFSGRFARYLLSRQLKTKKKHEAWFRFSGKPVRFSLREFAIVTGLPCDNFPRKSKMKLKKTISEKPYWPTLFGKVEVVTVSSLIKMLYRKTVKDKEIRIKYACLALLESVLLPTSLNMKISREHAEAIEDLGEFFAFPWGRLSFDLLMGSIKERDEIGLSQNTIAVKGFVLGLQLVLVEAVPALTEVVDDTGSSSESDVEDLDGVGRDIFRKKHTLNPAHARSVDKRTDVSDFNSVINLTVSPYDGIYMFT